MRLELNNLVFDTDYPGYDKEYPVFINTPDDGLDNLCVYTLDELDVLITFLQSARKQYQN